MKRLLIAILCICLLAAATVASAQDDKFYQVTYVGNNCLASVPTDENQYKAGTNVSVKFDPVTYKDGLIFYGWDWNNDGVADFGYAYNNFTMPAKDVEMKAICIGAYSYAPATPYYYAPPAHHHHTEPHHHGHTGWGWNYEPWVPSFAPWVRNDWNWYPTRGPWW